MIHCSLILVLGMHRSGTSCLAGSLQQAGLELGDVFTANPFNAKGNREHRTVMELNDAVLAHSGGAWNDPPAQLSWSRWHARRRDRFLRELHAAADGRPLGFKDPRALLTLPFWQDAGISIRAVGTYRNPLAVARSLESRNRMALADGLALWQAYNERLLALHEEEPFPLVSFDAEEQAYLDRLGAVIRQLGLDESAEIFFEAALRRASAEDHEEESLPQELRELHGRLCALT